MNTIQISRSDLIYYFGSPKYIHPSAVARVHRLLILSHIGGGVLVLERRQSPEQAVPQPNSSDRIRRVDE